MKKNMTAEQKFDMMTQEPVNRLILSLALPTIISMLITSIYNMADAYFVSKISTSASGAVGIAFSLMAVIQAIGFTFGMGSGNYISRLLGQKKNKYASQVAATGFFSALILGTILSLLGLLFLEPLTFALGATDTIAPYAKDYIRYILIGVPYMTSAFVLNNILRFQGSAFYAMLGIGTGALLNIVLDPILIFRLGMGTGGAALATIISQFVSFCILFLNSGINGTIKIRFRNFSPKWKIYREILTGGLPSFYRQSLASISMIAMNFSAGPYGDAAIAAMSIVNRVFNFAVSAMIGFGQGFQPVCGFNYGAKMYDRVLDAFWFCVKISAVALLTMSILLYGFSSQIISAFRKEDLEVIAIGTLALKLQSIVLPLSAWIIMTNMLLQTIGRGMQASVVAVSRQGLFFLPAVLILPHIFGLLGVQMSQTVSDILSFLLTIPMAISVLRQLGSPQKKDLTGDAEDVRGDIL
ncbi:MAG: MATE family efflux transporter [Clostridiaceae bacterium]|jgi:putative MATE family efflux protein|nr:MATE family efflux transporter [Clostridiaceae bacterium]